MKNTLRFALAAVAISSAAIASPIAMTAFADPAVATAEAPLPSGVFTKKKYKIQGSWAVEQRGAQTVIVFSDDFKTKKGPDLKVFLSPKTVSDVTGKTATDGAVLLSVLTSNKGGQEFVLPEGVNLSDFESVLVHCEEFAVLWGGGDL